MGLWKCLGYVVGGVGAVVLIPATGGSSLAIAIGAMGTTTAAGAVIGASVGVAAAAVDHSVTSSNSHYQRGMDAGTKAGESAAQQKYEAKVEAMAQQLESYQDYQEKLLAFYALGLAATEAGGASCADKRSELDQYIAGCSADKLPPRISEQIEKLATQPPTLPQALTFAKRAKLPKENVDEIIDYFIHIVGEANVSEEQFVAQWKARADEYEASVG